MQQSLFLVVSLIAIARPADAHNVIAEMIEGFGKLEGYRRSDYQYFRPMLANIREPQNHMRFYGGSSPRFARASKQPVFGYWDVAFGERFILAGIEGPEAASKGPLKRPGAALFIDFEAHMLLDFDAVSNAVINTDFRVGGGDSWRPWFLNNLSLRVRGFHESTHLGDEYILQVASHPDSADFRRYNVGYNALAAGFVPTEVFLSYDRLISKKTKCLRPAYVRLYGGRRWLNDIEYEGVDKLFTDRESLFTRANEFQYGAEFYRHGSKDPNIFAFTYLYVAVELYTRGRYSGTKPKYTTGSNWVLGVMFGDGLGEEAAKTVRYQLNYYNGINPHGQFRSDKLDYLGFDVIMDF